MSPRDDRGTGQAARMERPALFVGDAEEGAATLKEAEVRFLLGIGFRARSADFPFSSDSQLVKANGKDTPC